MQILNACMDKLACVQRCKAEGHRDKSAHFVPANLIMIDAAKKNESTEMGVCICYWCLQKTPLEQWTLVIIKGIIR